MFVVKYVYGYGCYFIFFVIFWIFGCVFVVDFDYGDIVVFWIVKDDMVDYIKCVVGLFGDCV